MTLSSGLGTAPGAEIRRRPEPPAGAGRHDDPLAVVHRTRCSCCGGEYRTDLSPQLMEDAARALFDVGAVDVWQTPILMKHGRLAVTLSALVREVDVERVTEGFPSARRPTLGVRHYPVMRSVLDREVKVVEVRGSPVRVKRGRLGGTVVTSMPEHGDLRHSRNRRARRARAVAESLQALQAPAEESGPG